MTCCAVMPSLKANMRTLTALFLLCLLLPSVAVAQVPTPTTDCPTIRAVAYDRRGNVSLYVVTDGMPIPLKTLQRMWNYIGSVVTPENTMPYHQRVFLWNDGNWILGDEPCWFPSIADYDYHFTYSSFWGNIPIYYGVVTHEFAHAFGAVDVGSSQLSTANIWLDESTLQGMGANAYNHTCPPDDTLCTGLERAIWGR